jgi:hypothetical protein
MPRKPSIVDLTEDGAWETAAKRYLARLHKACVEHADHFEWLVMILMRNCPHEAIRDALDHPFALLQLEDTLLVRKIQQISADINASLPPDDPSSRDAVFDELNQLPLMRAGPENARVNSFLNVIADELTRQQKDLEGIQERWAKKPKDPSPQVGTFGGSIAYLNERIDTYIEQYNDVFARIGALRVSERDELETKSKKPKKK